jgi:methyltransferase-like protein 6
MSYSTVTRGVTPFLRGKYERDARRSWDAFYSRNGERFYRDRHWLLEEATDGFPCLASGASTVLECGCGAANAAFPLLAANPRLRVFAFDFAPAAVALVRGAPAFDPARITAFAWDFARHDLDAVPAAECAGLAPDAAVDYALCLFVLSAVPPSQHGAAVRRVARLLRPGGQLLFRDYCVGDMAAARFKPTRRIDDHYFVRQDATLSYFFDEARLDAAMRGAGLVPVGVRRILRTVVNRREEKAMHRVFLQAVYEKPAAAAAGCVT